MLDSKEYEKEDFFKIEGNLLLLRCMIDNIRLISVSEEVSDSIGSALFGIMLTIDNQMHDIENKLGHTVGI